MKQLPGCASLSKVAEPTLSREGRGQGIGNLRLKVRPRGHKCVCFKEQRDRMEENCWCFVSGSGKGGTLSCLTFPANVL